MHISWDSDQTQILYNPRLPEEDQRLALQSLEGQLQSLQSHVLVLSSGTTAESAHSFKWVALKKQALLKSAQAVNEFIQSDSRDVWLHLLPDFHVGGIGIRARAYMSGARVVSISHWDVSQVVSWVERDQVSLISLVPAQIFDLVHHQVVCPASVRVVLVGGGALSASLYAQARYLGWPILMTYGMTETCSSVAITPMESLRHLPNDPKDLRLDLGLEVLSHFEAREGELQCLRLRGESLFTGYIHSQGGSASQWEDPKKSGWFETSDRAQVTGRSVKVLGRLGDFIKIGGESVEMIRLSALLEKIRFESGVHLDLAVIAYPDERLGHVIHLVYQKALSPELLERVILAFNSSVLPFEKIRKAHALDEIPRTSLKKLKTAECLRQLIAL